MMIVSAEGSSYYTISVCGKTHQIKWKNRWCDAIFYHRIDAEEKAKELLKTCPNKWVEVIYHKPTTFIIRSEKNEKEN